MDPIKKMNIDINSILEEHISISKSMFNHADKIQNICDLTINALKNNNKIIFCGNGGSAADSNHLAAELVGRFEKNRKSLPAISLSSNTSNLTSIANDYGFEYVFERQLSSIGKKGDVLIALSTSGNSSNIVNVIKKSQEMGIHCIGLTGNDGGKIAKLNCSELLIIESKTTARIQEMHLLFGHVLCKIVEQELC